MNSIKKCYLYQAQLKNPVAAETPLNVHLTVNAAKGVYKATILHQNINVEYIGSTVVSFKTRYNQNKSSLKPNKSTRTTLLAYKKITT